MDHVNFALVSAGIAAALFIAMLVFVEIGRRVGQHRFAKRGNDSRAGVGVVDGAVFAVLALIIGFTFNGAAGRFDKRRDMVVQQANAISTAWQRILFLPREAQPPLRAEFQRYVDALLTAYDHPAGSAEELRARGVLTDAQNQIWNTVMDATTNPSGEKARMLLVPAVNEMFDAIDTERMAQRVHPPMLIYLMLGLSALAAALFAGYAMSTAATRNWLYIIGFTATISITSFVVIELESPRLGLLRVDQMSYVLEELRISMN